MIEVKTIIYPCKTHLHHIKVITKCNRFFYVPGTYSNWHINEIIADYNSGKRSIRFNHLKNI
jgi:hypothetical protein